MNEIREDFLSDNKHSVFIMDNARIHHAEIIRNWFTKNDLNIKFLHVYSPELNSIDEVFGTLKGWYASLQYNPITVKASR